MTFCLPETPPNTCWRTHGSLAPGLGTERLKSSSWPAPRFGRESCRPARSSSSAPAGPRRKPRSPRPARRSRRQLGAVTRGDDTSPRAIGESGRPSSGCGPPPRRRIPSGGSVSRRRAGQSGPYCCCVIGARRRPLAAAPGSAGQARGERWASDLGRPAGWDT